MRNQMKYKIQKIRLALLTLSFLVWNAPVAAQGETRTAKIAISFLDQKKSEILYENSYALVVGVSDYATDGWDDLPGVARDLAAVEESLRKHNFLVTKIVNPKKKDFDDGVRQFLDDFGVQPENRLLIYFAGHGYTRRLPDGRELGYIIPADAPHPDKDADGFSRKAVSMDTIQYFAKLAQSKHVLFMFDSCFSGKLISRDGMKISEFIRESVANPVRQFITSGAANQTVPDESIFREFFMRALNGEADRNRDGYILGSELADYLKENVTNYSIGQQTPLYGKIRDIDLDKGDFVFVSPKAAKRSAPVLTAIAARPIVSIDFWETRRALAFGERSAEENEVEETQPKDENADDDTLERSDGLKVPRELFGDGVIKQKQKIKEMTLKLPKDYADLATMYWQKELTDLPIATESYYLDVGCAITGKSLTSFDFEKGSVKLTANSDKYQILENLADNFSGEKYDLEKTSDRREIKIHLLQMLHPTAKTILEQVAAAYQKKFDRPLRVTSMVRSMEYQIEMNLFNANSFKVRGEGSLPPHTTGFTFDLARTHMPAEEQNFVMEELAKLERDGKVDALIEYGVDPCFHVFVYPDGKPPKEIKGVPSENLIVSPPNS